MPPDFNFIDAVLGRLAKLLFGSLFLLAGVVISGLYFDVPDFAGTKLGASLVRSSTTYTTTVLLSAVSCACSLVQLVELSLEVAFQTQKYIFSFERPMNALVAGLPAVLVALSYCSSKDAYFPFAFAFVLSAQFAGYNLNVSKLISEAYYETFSLRTTALGCCLILVSILLSLWELVQPQMSAKLTTPVRIALAAYVAVLSMLIQRAISKRGLGTRIDWNAPDLSVYANLYLFAIFIYLMTVFVSIWPIIVSGKISWLGFSPFMVNATMLASTFFTVFVTTFSKTVVVGNRLLKNSAEHDARLEVLLAAEKRELKLAKAAAFEEARSQSLIKERELTLRLLYSIMPPKIANDLSNGREVMPQGE
jgi:hypothetical protein